MFCNNFCLKFIELNTKNENPNLIKKDIELNFLKAQKLCILESFKFRKALKLRKLGFLRSYKFNLDT